MYNWYSVNDSRNIAPTGWHVPTDAEWTTLTTYLGGVGVAGGKLKESGTSHWFGPNTSATNETGFTALPGGYRYNYGAFVNIGLNGSWWSSTEAVTSVAIDRLMSYLGGNVNKINSDMVDGLSIRCVRDIPAVVLTTTPVTNNTQTFAVSGGNITSDGGVSVTGRGVCWSTGTTPTIADSKTSDGTGTGSFTSNLTGLLPNTTYYVRSYATNSTGTYYGITVSFTTLPWTGTVTDIDGNVYNTVTIGTQIWMVENLKTTKYRNGDAIPNVTDNTAWLNLTMGAYCDYNNDLNP